MHVREGIVATLLIVMPAVAGEPAPGCQQLTGPALASCLEAEIGLFVARAPRAGPGMPPAAAAILFPCEAYTGEALTVCSQIVVRRADEETEELKAWGRREDARRALERQVETERELEQLRRLAADREAE